MQIAQISDLLYGISRLASFSIICASVTPFLRAGCNLKRMMSQKRNGLRVMIPTRFDYATTDRERRKGSQRVFGPSYFEESNYRYVHLPIMH